MARRLVVAGRFRPGSPTIEMRVDTSGNDMAVAEGLPAWGPHPSPAEPDHDLIRKQRIEDEL